MIVSEMQNQRENKSAELQSVICEALGLTEEQFNDAGSTLIASSRTEELMLAQQGQLNDN